MPRSARWPTQFRLRTLLFAVLVVAGIASGLMRAGRIIRRVGSANAADVVAQLCIDHMRANQDRWPRHWDDLSDEYATYQGRTSDPWTFRELQARVAVDFEADPRQSDLTRDSLAHETSWIASRDGVPAHGPRSRVTPDDQVMRYLKSNAPP